MLEQVRMIIQLVWIIQLKYWHSKDKPIEIQAKQMLCSANGSVLIIVK